MLKALVIDKEIRMSEKEKELAELRRAQKNIRSGRIARDSRERLKKIAQKKFRTCFIFALSEFENKFGVLLWGHGLSDDEITSEQSANKIIWEQIRKNILDNGNTQSRALGMELDLHNIEFEGYQMTFGGKSDGK